MESNMEGWKNQIKCLENQKITNDTTLKESKLQKPVSTNLEVVISQLRIMLIQKMQQKYMSSSTMIQNQSKMHLLKWVKD